MVIRQVKHAFELLEFFAARKAPATLTQIADHFSWPRSSTFNMIETLTAAGMLHEPLDRGGYYPTHRLLQLANEIVSNGAVSATLRDIVARVATQTGETVALGSIAGSEAVFLEVVESRHAIRYFARVGQRVPLHATAIGRALLSMLEARERAALLMRARFERHAPASLMTAAEVEAEIAASRARGWYFNNNGFAPDLMGVAVPLAGDARLALLVAGPAFRLQDRTDELARALQAEVDQLACTEGTGPS